MYRMKIFEGKVQRTGSFAKLSMSSPCMHAALACTEPRLSRIDKRSSWSEPFPTNPPPTMPARNIEFNPTSARLRSIRAAVKCSNHPLREFASLTLQVLQSYDEHFPLEIQLLIAAVYEFGVAKVDARGKTDMYELDELKEALSIVTSGKVPANVSIVQERFEYLSKVENQQSSSTAHAFAVPPKQSPQNLYQNCCFHRAERDIYTSKVNDHSVKSNCYNRSNHELNANLHMPSIIKSVRKPRRGTRFHRASRVNKTREELRTHIRSQNFRSKSRERRRNSKLASGYEEI
ncbi:hypothetical protein GYMLUDRAFT_263760 [Collybiopsis luxurians FD-317 M1]|uniref:Uncharacterized protein n=1 Tax=Collybiopsis luxurians FD-317 M1 TaxID=944289 RepID=A0A0D0C1S9_9AGAR|nr:hypothetical protein GYMLUDRAFT_263760 [Collybiopsis luxurians FD-317 M1]